MLPTIHDTPEVDEGDRNKPIMIQFYNKTKGGIDTVDQMIDMYGAKVGSRSRRWPIMVIFYNELLEWKETHPQWFQEGRNRTRRDFLKELGMALSKPEIERRAADPVGLKVPIRMAVEQVLDINLASLGSSRQYTPTTSKPKCSICIHKAKVKGHKARKHDANKAYHICSKCGRRLCSSHAVKIESIICEICNAIHRF